MTSINVIITATDEYRRIVKTLAERDSIFFVGGVSDYLRDVIDDFNKTFFAARRLAIPDKELHPEGNSRYRAVWKFYGVVLEKWERTTNNLRGEIEMRPKSRDQVLFSLDWQLGDPLGEDYFNVLSRLLKERHGFDLIPAASPRDGERAAPATVEDNGKRPPKDEIVRRRAKVEELAGLPVEEISERLANLNFKSYSVSTVNRDLKEKGLVSSRKPQHRNAKPKGNDKKMTK